MIFPWRYVLSHLDDGLLGRPSTRLVAWTVLSSNVSFIIIDYEGNELKSKSKVHIGLFSFYFVILFINMFVPPILLFSVFIQYRPTTYPRSTRITAPFLLHRESVSWLFLSLCLLKSYSYTNSCIFCVYVHKTQEPVQPSLAVPTASPYLLLDFYPQLALPSCFSLFLAPCPECGLPYRITASNIYAYFVPIYTILYI